MTFSIDVGHTLSVNVITIGLPIGDFWVNSLVWVDLLQVWCLICGLIFDKLLDCDGCLDIEY